MKGNGCIAVAATWRMCRSISGTGASRLPLPTPADQKPSKRCNPARCMTGLRCGCLWCPAAWAPGVVQFSALIQFQSLNRDYSSPQERNAAKVRALKQGVNYETFKHMVSGARNGGNQGSIYFTACTCSMCNQVRRAGDA